MANRKRVARLCMALAPLAPWRNVCADNQFP